MHQRGAFCLQATAVQCRRASAVVARRVGVIGSRNSFHGLGFRALQNNAHMCSKSHKVFQGLLGFSTFIKVPHEPLPVVCADASSSRDSRQIDMPVPCIVVYRLRLGMSLVECKIRGFAIWLKLWVWDWCI